jgi:hypothetical protein
MPGFVPTNALLRRDRGLEAIEQLVGSRAGLASLQSDEVMAVRSVSRIGPTRASGPSPSSRAIVGGVPDGDGHRTSGSWPSTPASDSTRRHSTRCDEYSPSRRNNVPISPGRVHASASRTTRSLYSAENTRRLGRSTSSGSGGPPDAPRAPRPCRVRCPATSQHAPNLALKVSRSLIVSVSPDVGREGTGGRLQANELSQSTTADAASSVPMVRRYWPFGPPHGPCRLLRRNQLARLPNQRERWTSRSC